jgi:hypothetical protein
MALKVEGVVNGGICGKEVLGRSGDLNAFLPKIPKMKSGKNIFWKKFWRGPIHFSLCDYFPLAIAPSQANDLFPSPYSLFCPRPDCTFNALESNLDLMFAKTDCG